MSCHSLLQDIFLAQGLKLGLLHCRQILYHLSHQGSPQTPREMEYNHAIFSFEAELRMKSNEQGSGNFESLASPTFPAFVSGTL